MTAKRFDIFRENHIGVGLRWEFNREYWLMLSLALPFFTVTLGIGAAS